VESRVIILTQHLETIRSYVGNDTQHPIGRVALLRADICKAFD
jgi:hypothetical protein